MGVALPVPQSSVETYLTRRHPVTLNHARLLARLAAVLDPPLRGSCCVPHVSPQFSQVQPDLAVLSGREVKAVFEVLSLFPYADEYGRKFALCRQIESLEEYVLVAQDEVLVEVLRRMPDGNWLLSSYRGLDQTAPIESLEIAIPLAELYEGIALVTEERYTES